MPPEVFYKKVVCENFAIFTRKHLCWSLRPTTLLKKETPTQMFFCEYWDISKKTYFEENLHTIAYEMTLGSDCFQHFLESCFQNHPDFKK